MNYAINRALVQALEERPGLAKNESCPEYPTVRQQRKAWESIHQLLCSRGLIKPEDEDDLTAPDLCLRWGRIKKRVHRKAKELERMKMEGTTRIPKSMRLTPFEKRILFMDPVLPSAPSTSSQNDPTSPAQITDPKTQESTSETRKQLRSRLISLKTTKLDVRKEELGNEKEKINLKKQKIELMHQQLTTQTNTLNQIKSICIQNQPK